MRSTARIGRHPIHPMLIAFPIGLWTTSLVFDVLAAISNNMSWHLAAYYMAVAGCVGALLAAIPGLIDLLNTVPPGTRVRKRGWTHAALNVTALALWVVSIAAREDPGEMSYLAYATAFLATGMVGISGWLGGTLVYENYVGVDGVAVREE